MSKGSRQRPAAIPAAELDDRWARTFTPRPPRDRTCDHAWRRVGFDAFARPPYRLQIDVCQRCGDQRELVLSAPIPNPTVDGTTTA